VVGYVVDEGRALNVPTPVYEKVYGELLKKLERAAKGEKR
jgi:hypothetical protein